MQLLLCRELLENLARKKKSCSVAWSLGGRRHKLGTSEGSEGLSPVPSAKVKVDLMVF